MNKQNMLINQLKHQVQGISFVSRKRPPRQKEFSLSSETQRRCGKNLLAYMALMALSIVLVPSNVSATEKKQDVPEFTTLLGYHQINLDVPETWPQEQLVPVTTNVNPHTLRIKLDPPAHKVTISLDKETVGDVITNLMAETLNPQASLALDHTFVINGQPSFIKCSVDSSQNMVIERISTNFNLSIFGTSPTTLHNGIDEKTFGIIESRGGSVLLGVNANYDTFDYIPGKAGPQFNPNEHRLQGFSNTYGGVFAPKGKILINAKDYIGNGRALEEDVTTNLVHGSGTVIPVQHKHFIGGNGSFMRSHSHMLFYSNNITTSYNPLYVGGNLELCQYSDGYEKVVSDLVRKEISLRGKIHVKGVLLIYGGYLYLDQPRDIPTVNSYGVRGQFAGVILGDFPEIEVEGTTIIVAAQKLYSNHLSKEEGGWKGVFKYKPTAGWVVGGPCGTTMEVHHYQPKFVTAARSQPSGGWTQGYQNPHEQFLNDLAYKLQNFNF